MADLHIHEQFISLLETHLGILLKISKAYTNTAQDREDCSTSVLLNWMNLARRLSFCTWMDTGMMKSQKSQGSPYRM